VETGRVRDSALSVWEGSTTLDYRVYDPLPKVLRRVEALTRTDLYLAMKARRLAQDYDVVWAGSERVAVPLTLLGVPRPLVVVGHHLESAWRRVTLQALGLAKHWAAVGYVSDAGRDAMVRDLGIPPERLFSFMSVDLSVFTPGPDRDGGPILSLGAAKRDYATLVKAVSGVAGCYAEILAGSRYGDRIAAADPDASSPRVHYRKWVRDAELVRTYQASRFVVIPLAATTHTGAGASAALEAAASGKAVVATRTAGMASWVVDGVTGLLVPAGDVSAMRDAIDRLWHDTDTAKAMGRAGRGHVAKKYDRSAVAREVQAVIQRVHAGGERD